MNTQLALTEHFSSLPDPRKTWLVKHQLQLLPTKSSSSTEYFLFSPILSYSGIEENL